LKLDVLQVLNWSDIEDVLRMLGNEGGVNRVYLDILHSVSWEFGKSTIKRQKGILEYLERASHAAGCDETKPIAVILLNKGWVLRVCKS
jgi:hypothetical protein